MIKKILFVLLLLVGLFLIGCNNGMNSEEDGVIMPNDMPDDFMFSLKYGVKALNEINTFEQTYTKDLVLDGTVTTELELTKAELRKIYQKMKEIEILDTVLKAVYIGEDGAETHIEPRSDYYLTVQINEEIYSVEWTNNIHDEDTRNELARFVNFLHDEIISIKSEYLGLPEPSGSYQ